jgi:thymidylate synthase
MDQNKIYSTGSKFVDYELANLYRMIYSSQHETQDRTGIGTRVIMDQSIKLNIEENFPLLYGKKIHVKSVLHELLWFLRGETNVKSLNQEGVTIWDEWADPDGELGKIYGYQWKFWGGDQIQKMIDTLRNNPQSRRNLVSAWNVEDIEGMGLPPCHYAFQANVIDDRLFLTVNMRSTDIFLGLPFNIASYSFLAYMLGHVTNLKPTQLTINMANCHLYLNHVNQVAEYMQRIQDLASFGLEYPKISILKDTDNIFDIKYEDIEIKNYKPLDAIPAPIAV